MSRAADESPTRPPPASPATDACSHRRRQTAAAKLPATGADSCGRTSPTVGSGSSRRTSWQDLVVVVSLYTGYCLGLLLLLVSVAGTGESQVSSFLKHYTKVYCIVYIVPLSLCWVSMFYKSVQVDWQLVGHAEEELGCRKRNLTQIINAQLTRISSAQLTRISSAQLTRIISARSSSSFRLFKTPAAKQKRSFFRGGDLDCWIWTAATAG